MEDFIRLREDTSIGYVDAHEGDGVQLGYTAPTALLRAVVGHQRANTLTCNSQMGVVVREVIEENNKSAKHQQDLLQHKDDVCRNIPAGTHESTPHLLKTVVNERPLRIRKLTPRECWRLQGFPDDYFDRAVAAGVSNSQLYKQAGNGVSVNISEVIGRRLKEIEDMENGY